MTRIAILAPRRVGLALPHPASLLAQIVAGAALRRSRRSLATLDDHLLRDIGLTRQEALREASQPDRNALDRAPWDAPAHWLR